MIGGTYPLSGHLRFGPSSIIGNKQQMPRLTLFGTCLTRPKDSILKEFLPGRQRGLWSVDIDAERALCKHKYFETVPLLAPFVAEDFTASEAEACLSAIVGHDLGPSLKAWIDWYAALHKRNSTPTKK
jgi:hypothetical protein